MQTAELTIRNPSGLHARPAALFVRTAARYTAKISVENLDRGSPPVDAKSVLLVLTAGVQRGHRIRLTAEGPDEEAAIAGLRELVEAGLGEPIEGSGGATVGSGGATVGSGGATEGLGESIEGGAASSDDGGASIGGEPSAAPTSG